jgi:ATP-dependent RNA helicase DDX31/DBP7
MKKENYRNDDSNADIHNARPKDVSKNALKWEKSNKVITTSTKIFTRTTFSDLQLHPFLSDLLQSPNEGQKKGFNLSTCTTIQAKSIPMNINNSRTNVLMKSQTGSGKTLSYLIPIINELMSLSPPVQREDGTRALIIAPTRELCNQIADVLSKLTQCCVRIVGGCLSGGEKKKSEKARLRKGIVVLTSTPGRLLDHIRATESFDLTNLRWIVMDEVDRLLDMGFEQTILEILSRIKGERLPGLKEEHFSPQGATPAHKSNSNLEKKYHQQNLALSKKVSHPEELRYLLASATLTNAVKQLAWPIMGSFNRKIGFCVVDGDQGNVSTIHHEDDLYYMKPDNSNHQLESDKKNTPEEEKGTKKLRSTMVSGEDHVDAPTRLAQYSMIVPCKWRLSALLSFLYLRRHQKVIVFFSTCDSVDFHALAMRGMNWPQGLEGMNFHQNNNNSSNNRDGDRDSREEGGGRGNGTGEKNDFTFQSFDEVNWTEHAALFERSLSQQNKNNNNSNNKGNNDSNAENDNNNPEAIMQSVLSKKRHSQSTTLDPLNWKFTGLFGENTPIMRLHGKVPQSIRKMVYKEFSKAKQGILLCTDVAARGLDLPKVDYILQYDPPCETSDYIHRIGRTARCGLAGSALLFVLPSEQLYLNLLSSYGLSLEPLSSQSMFQEIAKEIPGINPKKFKNYDEIASVVIQKTIESMIDGNKLLLLSAIQAYNSFLRAYTTHSADSKGIFRLNLVHLGHLAKSFGLKEKPKDFKNTHQKMIINDVIGKIFNGEFASKEFKANLLPKKSSNNNKKEEEEEDEEADDQKKKNIDKKQKQKKSTQAEEQEEEEEAEENEEENEEEDNQRMVISDSEDDEQDEEEEKEEEEEEEEEELDHNEKNKNQKKRKLESETDVSNNTNKNSQKNKKAKKEEVEEKTNKKQKKNESTTVVPPALANPLQEEVENVFGLGKRKLSFGKKSGKKSLAPSGKFRKGGSYFRKKLRSKLSSEFSAN